MDDEPRSVTAADAFGALASEHRVDVLRAFAAAQREGLDVLSFTELYDAVDVGSTSQLSYHVDELVGVFVRSVDGGYELTQAGEDVMRAVLSGVYTGTPSFEPVSVSGECPSCPSSDLVASYQNDLLTVQCDECGVRVVTYDLPPAAVEGRDERAVLASTDVRVRFEYALAVRGACSKCAGSTAVHVEERGSPGEAASYAVATCRHCHNRVFAPVEVVVLWHPAVIAFYWEQGVDATAVPFWDLSQFVREWTLSERATDSYAVEVTVRESEATLSLLVRVDADGSLSVDVQE